MCTNNTRVGDVRPLKELGVLNRAAYSRNGASSVLEQAGIRSDVPATGVVYQEEQAGGITEVWMTTKPTAYDLDGEYRRIQ